VFTLVVLRHALAGDRATWGGDDRSRPLNREGIRQSLALVEQLGELPINRLLTSPFVRCQHTVAPLAAVRRLPVIEQPWLAEGAAPSEIRRGLSTVDSDTLLCTHGDCVRLIVDEICADGELPTRFELEKAAALAFRFDDGVVIDAAHVPAPLAGRGIETVRLMAI
jgi:8-oxo-(d)GTP phosphatase